MMYLLTEGERRFLKETFEECQDYSDDLEDACEECLVILNSLQPTELQEEE